MIPENKFQEFAEHVARMKTEEEFGEDQPDSEDWICTLNELIEWARQLTGVTADMGGAIEDKCRFCDSHIGWSLHPLGAVFALGICEDCNETICEPCKDGEHDSCEDTELNEPCSCREHEPVTDEERSNGPKRG